MMFLKEKLAKRKSLRSASVQPQPRNAFRKNQSPLTLWLKDKHEPFGTIDIEAIKRMLAEEDFAQMQSLYYFMMRDLKIASAVLARRQPLLSLPYQIISENEAFKEWVQKEVDLSEVIHLISSAIYYGVSLIDVGYEVTEGKLRPRFRAISPRFLHAHREQALKTTPEHLYLKQGQQKRFISQLDADKVIFHKHPIDIGEITDFSLASKLVWYFSLKHLTLAHHLQYFDAVATPPLIAKAGSAENSQQIIEALHDLKSASVGVFDKEDTLEFLQVTGRADFLNFIEYLDRQIATLILGNTLSTSEGNKGSYSQSKVHENRQKETLIFDARLIASTLSDYLNRLERLNFSQPQGVRFAFDLKAKKDLKELSEVVKNLSDSGYELNREDIEEQFGLQVAGKKEPIQTPKHPAHQSVQTAGVPAAGVPAAGVPAAGVPAAGVPAAGVPANESNAKKPLKPLPLDEIERHAQELKTEAMENELLGQMEGIMNQATSYEDAKNQLLAAYPSFQQSALEEALFTHLANSEIQARAEVEAEKSDEG